MSANEDQRQIQQYFKDPATATYDGLSNDQKAAYARHRAEVTALDERNIYARHRAAAAAQQMPGHDYYPVETVAHLSPDEEHRVVNIKDRPTDKERTKACELLMEAVHQNRHASTLDLDAALQEIMETNSRAVISRHIHEFRGLPLRRVFRTNDRMRTQTRAMVKIKEAKRAGQLTSDEQLTLEQKIIGADAQEVYTIMAKNGFQFLTRSERAVTSGYFDDGDITSLVAAVSSVVIGLILMIPLLFSIGGPKRDHSMFYTPVVGSVFFGLILTLAAVALTAIWYGIAPRENRHVSINLLRTAAARYLRLKIIYLGVIALPALALFWVWGHMLWGAFK